MNLNRLQQLLIKVLHKERGESITDSACSSDSIGNINGIIINNNTIIVILCAVFILGLLAVLVLSLVSYCNQYNERQKFRDSQAPYTQLGHPLKYNIDKFLSMLFPLLFPFDSLCQESYTVISRNGNENENENENEQETKTKMGQTSLTKLRQRIEWTESKLHAISCHLWNQQCKKNKLISSSSSSSREESKTDKSHSSTSSSNNDEDYHDYLVGGTLYVRRQENILEDWNIVQSTNTNTTDNNNINHNNHSHHDHQREIEINNSLRSACNGGMKDAKNNLIQIEITCPASCIRNREEILSLSSSFSSSSSPSSPPRTNNQHHSNSWRQQLVHGYQNIFPSSSFIHFKDVQFEKGCPIIIYFHGGGMVCGSSRDGTFILDFFSQLSAKKSLSPLSSSSSSSNSSKGIVVLSVTYRLAPEHPFPNSIIDCLSAASCIIERSNTTTVDKEKDNDNDSNNIHIAGFSAGGQLATVVGLECYRRYPGIIKSIVPLDPMLLPHADTLSYHLNSLSSSFCPALFVRWCWSAYLQLKVENEVGDDNNDKMINFDNVDEYTQILEKSSWLKPYIKQKEKKRNTFDNNESTNVNYNSGRATTTEYGLTRLFYPRIDLPKKLNGEKAPVIIVKTSTADVLRDDGCDLVRALKAAGANVIHFEMVGSHGISSWFGNNNNGMIDTWSTIIWDGVE